MRYLDPKADLTFKKVFGEHLDLVISLLNVNLINDIFLPDIPDAYHDYQIVHHCPSF